MKGNNYSNGVLMKLFILHGQCDQITARTCRRFNEMFPDEQPMNKRKFVRLQNNIIDLKISSKKSDKVTHALSTNIFIYIVNYMVVLIIQGYLFVMASVNKIGTRIVDIDCDSDCSESGKNRKHRHHRPHHHDHHDHHHHHDRDHHHHRQPACIKNITVYSVEERRIKTRKVKEIKYDNPWCCQKF